MATIIDVQTGKKYRGKSSLQKYNEGKHVSPRGRIEAKCYDCMGGYPEGPVGCNCPHCPLYPDMPYRGRK